MKRKKTAPKSRVASIQSVWTTEEWAIILAWGFYFMEDIEGDPERVKRFLQEALQGGYSFERVERLTRLVGEKVMFLVEESGVMDEEMRNE